MLTSDRARRPLLVSRQPPQEEPDQPFSRRKRNSRDDWARVPGRDLPKAPITTVIVPGAERRLSTDRGGSRSGSGAASARVSHVRAATRQLQPRHDRRLQPTH